MVKKFGLTCAMVSSGTPIEKGFNRRENHDWLVGHYEKMIPLVAEAGFRNLICFSGNRGGMDDEEGWRNCAEGIKRLLPLCEKHNVVLVMELLNSKVDHRDYMCDRTAWGVELCKRIGSEYFKLLYDIYHYADHGRRPRFGPSGPISSTSPTSHWWEPRAERDR